MHQGLGGQSVQHWTVSSITNMGKIPGIHDSDHLQRSFSEALDKLSYNEW